jgi:Flp pilus assembly protein TadG
MFGFLQSRVMSAFGVNRSGNVAVASALTAPVVLIAIGAAVDYSHAVSERAKMQAALDSAVIAGAQAAGSGSQTAISVAQSYFSQNITWAGPTATFQFDSSGALTGSSSYQMPTLFGAFTGAATLPLNVTAAASGQQQQQQQQNKVCILLLSPNASQSLLANSGTNLNGPKCEIDVTSTASPAAIFNAGGQINSAKLCIQGSNIINNGGSYTNLATNCSTVANPYVGKLPAPPSTTCSGPNAWGGNYNGGSVTLSPGVYCGGFNFNGAPNVTLLPGVYVIEGGGWNVNGGTWTGSGVTFYFADSSRIQFNSTTLADLALRRSRWVSRSADISSEGVARTRQGWPV